MIIFIKKVDQILVEDRESLLEHEVLVLKDCKEIAEMILNTADPNLRRMYLVEISVKLSAFFSKNNVSSFQKKRDQNITSWF